MDFKKKSDIISLFANYEVSQQERKI